MKIKVKLDAVPNRRPRRCALRDQRRSGATFKHQPDGSYILHNALGEQVGIDGQVRRTTDREEFEWLRSYVLNLGLLHSREAIKERMRLAH